MLLVYVLYFASQLTRILYAVSACMKLLVQEPGILSLDINNATHHSCCINDNYRILAAKAGMRQE